MIARLFVTSLSVAILALAGACEPNTCTAAGCGPLLSFTIEGPGGVALPEASYDITVDLDGSVHTITCSTVGGNVPACGNAVGEGPLRLSGDLVINRGTLDFTVYEDDPSDLTIAQVSVMVTSDGATVADEDWAPVYETHTPNFNQDGEPCGGDCTNATESLAIEIEVPEA